MPSDAKWYYVDPAGTQQGPVSEDALFSLLEGVSISRQTLVWRDGLTEWTPFAVALKDSLPPPVPSNGPPPVPSTSTQSADPRVQHFATTPSRPLPWRRFFAKYLDMTLTAGAGVITITLALEALGAREAQAAWVKALDNAFVSLFIVCGLWSLIDAALLSITGSTLGRWLFAVRLRKRDGSRLNFGEAFKRNLGVWLYGMGLGIPIVTLVTCIMSYNKLVKTGTTNWDTEAGTVVEPEQSGVGPIVGMVLLALFGLVVILAILTNK